jgi:hypothetical protein
LVVEVLVVAALSQMPLAAAVVVLAGIGRLPG